MERDGHHAVGVVERELDTVTVVNVNVNVEDTWVISSMLQLATLDGVTLTEGLPEQLEDC